MECLASEGVFDADGALAAVLPGYESRSEQAALAGEVERALATGEHLLAEAGTGVGKSLAYLIPALQSGRRVVVATATKALQEQLLRKDVPLAAAALGRSIRVEVLKGRQNYLCRRQLHTFQPFLLADGRDAQAWEAMQGWLEATETGDRAELVVEPSDAFWAELAVGSDRCSGRRCPFHGGCFAEAARGRAAEADLVIANHALYFADLAGGGGVLPEHDAVIFDEAHRLEESAAAWLGGGISRAGLRRLALDVERTCRERSEVLPHRAVDRVERTGERLLTAVAPPAGRKRVRVTPRDEAAQLGDALVALAHELQGRGEELDGLGRRAIQLAAEVESLLAEPGPAATGPERVVWAEPGVLAWAPIDVSTELRDRLWEPAGGDPGPTAILV